MKNIVRAFVVVLALTGAAATTMISSPASASTSTKVTFAKVSAMPIPTCPPGGADGCGIADGGK